MYTPRISNIWLPIHISVKSCICSDQIKSNQNIDKLTIFEQDFCILHMPMAPLSLLESKHLQLKL